MAATNADLNSVEFQIQEFSTPAAKFERGPVDFEDKSSLYQPRDSV